MTRKIKKIVEEVRRLVHNSPIGYTSREDYGWLVLFRILYGKFEVKYEKYDLATRDAWGFFRFKDFDLLTNDHQPFNMIKRKCKICGAKVFREIYDNTGGPYKYEGGRLWILSSVEEDLVCDFCNTVQKMK
ncbi:MAG: hypothetical protein ACTSU2_08510 [Promethearchaeota archaeon]